MLVSSSDFRIGHLFLFLFRSATSHLLYDNLLDVLIEASRRLQQLLPLHRRQPFLDPRSRLSSQKVRAPAAVCGHRNRHVLGYSRRSLLLLLVLV